jgi:phosphate transport system substrate-binding protein
LAIARDDDGPYVIPTIATVNDNSYPVARDLYMYTAGEPAGAIKDYIDWILSSEAQKIVADLGFVPIK